MAKLSARGRTLVYGVKRMSSDDAGGSASCETRRLMSDNSVLSKIRTANYQSSWRLVGKLKDGKTPDKWLADKLANGWTKE